MLVVAAAEAVLLSKTSAVDDEAAGTAVPEVSAAACRAGCTCVWLMVELLCACMPCDCGATVRLLVWLEERAAADAACRGCWEAAAPAAGAAAPRVMNCAGRDDCVSA